MGILKKLEVSVKNKWLKLDECRPRAFLLRALFLIHIPSPHRVRWWLIISFFFGFATFKRSCTFCGSKYDADGLKPILMIWGGFFISNAIPHGIISGVRYTGQPWYTNQCRGINQLVLCYSEWGKVIVTEDRYQSMCLISYHHIKITRVF